MTLLEFLNAVYRLGHPGLSNRTLYLYRRACDSFSLHLGRRAILSDLTQATVGAWLVARMEQVSPKTAKREARDIWALWKAANEDGLANPPPKFPTIRIPKRTPTATTVEQLSALLVYCRTLKGRLPATGIRRADWWCSFYLALYDTGARPTAMINVQSADYHPGFKTIILRAEVAKTRIEQVCPVSNQTAEAIESHHDTERKFLWPWPHHPRLIWTHSQQHRKAVGIPTDRYHSLGSLRKSTASYAAANGSVSLAQAALGHTSAEMTERVYIDPRIARKASAVDVLPRPEF